MNEEFTSFKNAILTLDQSKAKEVVINFTKNSTVMDGIEKLVVPVMEDIGNGWESGEVALSQVYMGGRICEEIIDELLPPASEKRKDCPKMALALYNDYHKLGKRLVYSFVRAAGFEIRDFGDIHDIDEMIKMIKASGTQVLLISTLMLHSALKIKELTGRIAEEGLSVKIIVGGAPFRFDSNLYNEVGAYAMATHASQVVEILEKL